MPSTINVIPDPISGQLRKKGAADANLTIQTNSINAVVIDNAQNANFVSTGATTIPRGTTAQRPASPINGMIRYNTSYSLLEGYINGAWTAVTGAYTYTATYLATGGGGGGGTSRGGGGGGGGVLSNTATLTIGTVYTITVGAGGNYGSSYAVPSTNGGNSSIANSGVIVNALGGGAGANDGGTAGNGGSGGGGGTAGTGTSGQGYNGGSGTGSASAYAAGGGGGAGSAGSSFSGQTAGNGGNGFTSTITGSSINYGGGGGGGCNGSGTAGSGGTGGGGAGSAVLNTGNGTSGTVNYGGGGGGGSNWSGSAGFGGSGGSGIVILSIPTSSFSNTYTGSNTVVTTSGSNKIITFNASGTYTA